MPQRPRVLLLISHLGGGGAERVAALLARGLPAEKYEVHLALVTQSGMEGERLPRCVTVHKLGAHRARGAAIQVLRLVWRLRPAVLLSGIAHLNFLVLLLRPFLPRGTTVLVRQNATVSAALASGDLPRYTGWLYRVLYRRADRIICQSRAMALDMARELRIEEELLAVLPNPVDREEIRAAEGEQAVWPGSGPNVLAVGRLSREKGFDLLLDAFALVSEQFPSAALKIVGAGSEEGALRSQSRKLGVEEAVGFPGYVERPYAYFAEATVFVLSSRHEGMPNALIEAAAAGLPIVALPSSGGVVDFLRGQPGAWLAPQTGAAALAETLLAALRALAPGERFERTFAGAAEAAE